MVSAQAVCLLEGLFPGQSDSGVGAIPLERSTFDAERVDNPVQFTTLHQNVALSSFPDVEKADQSRASSGISNAAGFTAKKAGVFSIFNSPIGHFARSSDQTAPR